MDIFQRLFSATLEVFKVDFTLYDFRFSMWDIFIWTTMAGIILAFIGGWFHDD